ncbi:hypothetical protein GN958_ATG00989 [Phytophthora infestans]|uniref:Uncharacterized protein n=1 Tax=Phytophthora infestans TaxID=4787 RepID=A0A8S9VC93_PHYIN|nr:hypothetical protein GN958_ATG00989 [Phytophthora infestans]
MYKSSTDEDLVVFCNAAFAVERDSKSVAGYVIYFGVVRLQHSNPTNPELPTEKIKLCGAKWLCEEIVMSFVGQKHIGSSLCKLFSRSQLYLVLASHGRCLLSAKC